MTGNRWLVSIWSATPHKQPPLDLTELKTCEELQVYIHQEQSHCSRKLSSISQQPLTSQAYLDLHKRESDIWNKKHIIFINRHITQSYIKNGFFDDISSCRHIGVVCSNGCYSNVEVWFALVCTTPFGIWWSRDVGQWRGLWANSLWCLNLLIIFNTLH